MQLGLLRGGVQAAGGQQRGLQSDMGDSSARDWTPPFYWAAFIQSGDWRGMGEQPQQVK